MLKSTVLFYVVLLLVNAVSSVTLNLSKSEIESQFEQFKKTYSKTYSSSKIENFRKQVFTKSLEVIQKINSKKSSFVAGVTKFSDNTHEEIQKNLLTYREEEETLPVGGTVITSLFQSKKLKSRTKQASCFITNTASLATPIDYRTSALISPIRDQGWCGCCWAFSTVFNLEYMFMRKTGRLVDLSVQHLVDCNINNLACDGGTITRAFTWHTTVPTTDAVSYPYIDGKGTCKFATTTAITPSYSTLINTPTTLLKTTTDNIINALRNFGPLVTTMDASFLYYYVSGIFDPAVFDNYACTATNHAVNIVGAGIDTDTGKIYYIVRNSWGTGWGEAGYFRVFACVCQIGVRSMYSTMK